MSDLEVFLYDKLIDVRVSSISKNNRNEIIFENIELYFQKGVLQINYNVDTEEIIVNVLDKGFIKESSKDNTLFKHLLDSTLSSFWLAHNHYGYFDVIMFGFAEIRPNFIILAESGLKISNRLDDIWCERK